MTKTSLHQVTLLDLFGPSGHLSKVDPQYEAREPQLHFANKVFEALQNSGVLLAEAGTGTGKTLAYLIPALLSKKKVVISTATKALQDQIVQKDIPLLRKIFVELEDPNYVVLLKGVSNYLCRRRAEDALRGTQDGMPWATRHHQAGPVTELDKKARLKVWMNASAHGERSELDWLEDDDPLWSMVQSSTDTRIGPRCVYYDDCFVTLARQRAEQARIIVTNHHLFFADLVAKAPAGFGIMPKYDAVIFDEAHRLEDTATLFYGVELTLPRFERLVGDVVRGSGLEPSVSELVSKLRSRTDDLFKFLESQRGRRGAEERTLVPWEALTGPVREYLFSIDEGLDQLETKISELFDESELGAQFLRRSKQLRQDVGAMSELRDTHVVFTQKGPGGLTFGASPTDVSELFKQHVFGGIGSVVLTSATLSVNQTFEFTRDRLGIDFEIEELQLESPFDYPSQAALYLPKLPDPRADGAFELALGEVKELLKLSQGGTFLLTTSFKALRAFENALTPFWKGQLLVQGQAPKNTLLERFRQDGNALLIGTQSFWEGIDVRGHALRLVIIDRLPFEVPTDPLVEARCKQLELEGRSPFMEYLVPSAALVLKQGFGRLIRSKDDRGVVAILDGRLAQKGYGKTLLRALPPATRVEHVEELRSFLRNDQPDLG